MSVDLGFRYQQGYCQKNNNPGFNPNHLGECGNLTRARFVRQDLTKKNFSGASFNGIYAYASQWEQANLKATSFRRAILMQVDLKKSNGDLVDAGGAFFKAVNWSESKIREMLALAGRFNKVDFSKSDLTNSSFFGAHLVEVNFSECNLQGVNFEKASLLFVNFKNAKFDDKTKLPFSEEEAIQRGMIKVEKLSR